MRSPTRHFTPARLLMYVAMVVMLVIAAVTTRLVYRVAPSEPARAAASATTQLRVMDWNIDGAASATGGANWAGIESTISSEDPDIITLQEVHDNSGLTINGQPGINQYQELLDDFPAYQGLFGFTDENAEGGRNGNVILSKFPILQRVTYVFPNDNPASYVDRGMAGVNMDVNGTSLRTYTTHLSVGTTAGAVAHRQAQQQFILSRLPSLLITTPMLFTGDLNIRPFGVIRPGFAQFGLYDTWTELHNNIGADSITLKGSTDDARIDYTYASPALDVAASHTVNTGFSDHLGVVTDLTIRTPRALTTQTLLAGSDQSAGWGNISVYEDASARLRVCDNRADGWGVRTFVYDKLTGGLVFDSTDLASADPCGTASTAGGTVFREFTLKICRYQINGATQECRQRDIS